MFNESAVDSKSSATPCTLTYTNKAKRIETFYPFFGYAKEGQLDVRLEARTVLCITSTSTRIPLKYT